MGTFLQAGISNLLEHKVVAKAHVLRLATVWKVKSSNSTIPSDRLGVNDISHPLLLP